MSAELCFEMMKDYPPSLAASKKLDNALPEGFAWYEFEWVGDFIKTDTMKVTGQVFREATRGKNKGKRSIPVKGSRISIYINSAEIEKAKGGA